MTQSMKCKNAMSSKLSQIETSLFENRAEEALLSLYEFDGMAFMAYQLDIISLSEYLEYGSVSDDCYARCEVIKNHE